MVGEYEAYRKWLLWGALFFFLAVVVYFVFSLLLTADSRTRALSALKKTFTFEQTILLVIFLWYLLSIYLNGKRAGYPEIYFKALDWNIFDTFLCMLVLFPLPQLLGKERTKQFAECLIHIIVIAYSVFTIYCLWHIFQGEAVVLPSGYQAYMGEDTQLVLGMNANTTGGITATMLCLCVYMIVTQTWLIKIPYCVFGFFQLIALYLTNSRTPFLAATIFLVFVVFWLTWKAAGKKPVFLRILFSFRAAAVVFFVFWKARTFVLVEFQKITANQKALASSLTAAHNNYAPAPLAASQTAHVTASLLTARGEGDVRLIDGLSGRENVWDTCIRIMMMNKFNLFFGVTPGDTANQITTIGRFDKVIAHAHNGVLQVGITTGVPMMAAFIVFLLQIGIRCLRCLINKNLNVRYFVLLIGMILFLLINNMTEAYLFAVFSVLNCLFYLFTGWITEIDDEFYCIVPTKKKNIIKGAFMILTYAACIMAVFSYTDQYINLNHDRITGSGTKNDPYLIEDKNDLCYFRDLVNHGSFFTDCYFLQTKDIDLEGINWTPIGVWGKQFYFAGVYDGGCHKIFNLIINQIKGSIERRVGFFGSFYGTVMNLGIESGRVEGDYSASIACIAFKEGNAAIINCYNKAEIIGTKKAGGICDFFYDGIVINCLNEGKISAPRMGNLVSDDVNYLIAAKGENDITNTFEGEFIPLNVTGNTIQEKLNTGLEELINLGWLNRDSVRFWPEK